MSGYDTEQLFNCDKTGLQFHLLPHKTLAHAFEKRAKGRNKSKDRVTISACANVTGTIKLPPLLIGKAARPRCLTRMDEEFACCLQSPKNAWVNTAIFGVVS